VECRYRGLMCIFPPEGEIIAGIFASGVANNCSSVNKHQTDQGVSTLLAGHYEKWHTHSQFSPSTLFLVLKCSGVFYSGQSSRRPPALLVYDAARCAQSFSPGQHFNHPQSPHLATRAKHHIDFRYA
jgi:hypothetical protein